MIVRILRYLGIAGIFIFLFQIRMQAQTLTAAGLEFPSSYSWAHRPYMNHLTGRYVPGIQGTFIFQPSPERRWVKEYNYPETGISLTYQDLHHPSLGKMYAAFFHYQFFFSPRSRPAQWYIRIGNGVGYNTNPYDKITNPKNNVFGSHILYAFQLSVRFRYSFPSAPWIMEAGPGFYHYSNGSWKTPNLGLNLPGFHLAIYYRASSPPSEIEQEPQTVTYFPREWNVFIRLGFHETLVPGLGLHPSYTAGITHEWHPSYKHIYYAGAEIMASQSLKEYLIYQDIAFGTYNGNIPDYKRAAVIAGYRMYMDRTRLGAGVGVYFYNPSGEPKPVYFRLSYQKQLVRNWILGVSLKTHYFTAEIIDVGLHYLIPGKS